MAPPRSLEELVDRQARRWEVERRSAVSLPRLPCVALSRLPGSGGTELGLRLADRLNYGFFGVEIVDQSVRERGIQRRLVAGVDEHVRSVIDRHVVDAFRAGAFTESEYLRHVVRAIATLSERGMAVIVGRGAPFIIPPERALRVLAVAPTLARIERRAKSRGLSREQAAKLIEQEDADRRYFLRHHFGVRPEDPTRYDLVVNTGTLGMDAATALVLDALRHRFPKGRS
jgi:cytidylate kinase